MKEINLRDVVPDERMGGPMSALWSAAAESRDDPEFRARLEAEPRAMLGALGINFPAGIEVRLVCDTPEELHLVMPPDPNALLSDASLENISGGAPNSTLSSLPSTVSTLSSVE